MSRALETWHGAVGQVTPTSFLELLSSFVGILADKRTQVGTLQHRYSVGRGSWSPDCER